jgi:hypothetical protein
MTVFVAAAAQPAAPESVAAYSGADSTQGGQGRDRQERCGAPAVVRVPYGRDGHGEKTLER